MTDEVIILDDYRRSVRKFTILPCICTTCKRELSSVALEGTPWPRECDKCQTMTAVEEEVTSSRK